MLSLSENIESYEKVILKYLITTDEDYALRNENSELINRGKLIKLIQPTFFSSQVLDEIYRSMKTFYSDFGKIPNTEEIWQLLRTKNSEVGREELDIVFGTDMTRYSYDFFYKYLKTFVLRGSLERTLMGVVSHVKTHEITPDNIDEVFDFVRTEVGTSLNVDMTNENMGLSIYEPKSHIQPIRDKRTTGFPFLDKVLGGGWEPKTLTVFQGRPKVGKSLVLANLAVRAALNGANVGIFTVELGDRKYVKRVGSNLFNVNFEMYSKFIDEDNIEPINEAIAAFKERVPNAGELIIKEYPTGSASSIDVENYFISLQEKMSIKFDLILVDYINLLKPTSTKNEDTLYSKVKKISEELRRIAQRNEWCVVSATQVKAAYFNSEELHLDSTAESSGLVATVDSLFGLTGEPGSPRMKIKNLANRDEGHMESYKYYVKVKEYFRLAEDTAADSEYWSEDSAEDLESAMKKEYGDMFGNGPVKQPHEDAEPAYGRIPPRNVSDDFENEVKEFSQQHGFAEGEKKEAPEPPKEYSDGKVNKIDHNSILDGI